MAIYDPKSLTAEEFINHEEILETIRYAEENKHNLPLIDSILEKARPQKTATGVHCAGLSHREASVLLACDIPEKVEEMYRPGRGNQAGVLRQPHRDFRAALSVQLLRQRLRLLPVSREEQTHYAQKLTQDEVRAEVIALQDLGHKRLAIESGEDPVNNPDRIHPRVHQDDLQHQAQKRCDPPRQCQHRGDHGRELPQAQGGRHRHLYPVPETYHKQSYLELHRSAPSTTMRITLRRWTVQWRAASTM